jgi:zinc protease
VDQTAYVETAATEALDRLLFLEAERMSSALYDPRECDAERTVVISELQGGENDPEQLLDQEVTATALRVHPYGHPVIGWLHDLESIGREDLYEHYRRHYVPGNATLVVVGDVDADDVFRRAERHFGRIPNTPVRRMPRPAEPMQVGERRVTLEREGGAAYLKMAYPSPAAADNDFYPMLVLDAVLTGAKGVNLWAAFRGAPQRKARLYTRLVDEGLATAVSGALLPTIDPFIYTLSFTAADGVPLPALEQAVDAEIDRVRTVGISPEELSRAKRQLRARLIFDNDSITNIAHQLGYFETVVGADYLATLPTRLSQVTAADVSAIARRRLAPATRTTGWFRPLERP